MKSNCKLLTQNLTSHNDTQWEINKPITIDISGNEMCTEQVLHYYNHPLLAVFLNPIHARIKNPRLFEIEIDEQVNTDGLKFASKRQTLIKELELPVITPEQRTEIAIRVSKLVCVDQKWNNWADKWLSGEDRTVKSAAAYDAYYDDYYAAAIDAYCVSIAHEDKMEFNKKLIEIVEQVMKNNLCKNINHKSTSI